MVCWTELMEMIILWLDWSGGKWKLLKIAIWAYWTRGMQMGQTGPYGIEWEGLGISVDYLQNFEFSPKIIIRKYSWRSRQVSNSSMKSVENRHWFEVLHWIPEKSKLMADSRSLQMSNLKYQTGTKPIHCFNERRAVLGSSWQWECISEAMELNPAICPVKVSSTVMLVMVVGLGIHGQLLFRDETRLHSRLQQGVSTGIYS
jgi:hypothetical protein